MVGGSIGGVCNSLFWHKRDEVHEVKKALREQAAQCVPMAEMLERIKTKLEPVSPDTVKRPRQPRAPALRAAPTSRTDQESLASPQPIAPRTTEASASSAGAEPPQAHVSALPATVQAQPVPWFAHQGPEQTSNQQLAVVPENSTFVRCGRHESRATTLGGSESD